jgi:tetraprenyl-beta-curcumene synthase
MSALATERAFGSSALSYGSTVLPSVTRELSCWRQRAVAIPNTSLRRLALSALRKRGNMQGAALFAILAPRDRRVQATRALVAFQSAYNYLDALAEQSTVDPVGSGRQLHSALIDALDPTAASRDYYALYSEHGDGGYLSGMVDTVRACVDTLPSYPVVARSACTAAARIADYQSLNLGERQGGYEGLARWARARTPAGSDLRWWETAGAGGSSLDVNVLIALAAQPRLDPYEPAVIESAYFPWIGALHSLLDSVVDVAEDEREGQRNLLAYYDSTSDAAERMAQIVRRARSEARALPRGPVHEMILTAMVSYYLSAPEAWAPASRAIAASVAAAAGPLVKPALTLFKAARSASSVTHIALARAAR